ncbi:MAG: hypothetical protein H0T46_35170 [Deltaproteobacteria bacterium]|nr:hypothetical protein [Deltaproteobacteria bacterium]
MARWWTITIPSGYTDVTEEAKQAPQMAQVLQKTREKGGVLEMQLHQSADGENLIVLDSTFRDMPVTKATLDGFEEGARGTSFGTGRQLTYHIDYTPTMVVGTQQTSAPDGTIVWHKRWTGFGKDEQLKSLAIGCTGTKETCQPIFDSVIVEPFQFKAVASLAKGSSGGGDDTAYKIGQAVGVGLVCAIVLALVARSRKKSAANR